MNTTRLSVAILILRVGLGGFLLLWSIDKLVTPEGVVAIYQFFYHVSITTEIAYVIYATLHPGSKGCPDGVSGIER